MVSINNAEQASKKAACEERRRLWNLRKNRPAFQSGFFIVELSDKGKPKIVMQTDKRGFEINTPSNETEPHHSNRP